MGPSDKIWQLAFLAVLIVFFIYLFFRPNCFGCDSHRPSSRMARVSTDLRIIEDVLKYYAYENKSFPTSDQGLELLYLEKYLLGLPTDPWNRASVSYTHLTLPTICSV